MTAPNEENLVCQIQDVQRLYASYLPYVKNGAIFIPSNKKVALGFKIAASIILPGSNQPNNIQGEVIWVNHRTQGNRPSGFAVQLGTDQVSTSLKHEIERMLAGMSGSLQATYTM